MATLADFSNEKKYKAIVKKTSRLTPTDAEEVRELVIEVQDPAFHCAVNQSFGVLVAANGDFGNAYHHRLYSVADIPETGHNKTILTMLVKRCFYIDEFNGEKYSGLASNYLCDREKGDAITITGPHSLPFEVPADHSANLILIGMGTGIAPFRAFIKHIYQNIPDWKGQIRLFYGAKSGLELLYLNDHDGDLTSYYDNETFEAFHALSPRPHMNDPIAIDQALILRAFEIVHLLSLTNTYIYVAGFKDIKNKLDETFAKILGSKEQWETRKAELIAGKKWAEIIY